MKTGLLVASILVLVFAVFTTATSAIGAQCINSNAEYKTANGANYIYTVVNLVTAIVMILGSFVGMYFAVRTSSSS